MDWYPVEPLRVTGKVAQQQPELPEAVRFVRAGVEPARLRVSSLFPARGYSVHRRGDAQHDRPSRADATGYSHNAIDIVPNVETPDMLTARRSG